MTRTVSPTNGETDQENSISKAFLGHSQFQASLENFVKPEREGGGMKKEEEEEERKTEKNRKEGDNSVVKYRHSISSIPSTAF